MSGSGGWEKFGDVGQRITPSSFEMNKFWGPNVQYGDFSYNIVQAKYIYIIFIGHSSFNTAG